MYGRFGVYELVSHGVVFWHMQNLSTRDGARATIQPMFVAEP